MAYVYKLIHKPSNKIYIGCRYANGCNPEELLVSYMTSSKIVKNLIHNDGLESFEKEIIIVCDVEEVLLNESLEINRYEPEMLLNLCIPSGNNKFRINTHMLSISNKIAWSGDENRRKNLIHRMQLLWADNTFRTKTIESIKKTRRTEQSRLLSSVASKQRSSESILKLKSSLVEYNKNIEVRLRKSSQTKERFSKLEEREKQSSTLKNYYAQPENKEKIKKAREARWSKPHARDEMSNAMKNFHKGVEVWNRPTALKRRYLWAKADIIYGVWAVSGKGYKTIMKVLNLDGPTTIRNMLKMFYDGWIPSIDEKWLGDFKNGL